jgi:hypothetical protein
MTTPAQADFNWPSIEQDDRLDILAQISKIKDPNQATLVSMLAESDRWAKEILDNAGLPVEADKIRSKLSQLKEGSTTWFAGNCLLQTLTLRSALKNGDQATAILLGFLLADFRWQGHFAEIQEQEQVDEILVAEILKESEDDEELEIETYCAAINSLHKKFPHCTINALRLLLCNKLNVTKQRLDDLDITPDALK